MGPVNYPVAIHKLVNIIDKASGAVTKTRPRAVPKQSTATVEIQFLDDRKVCLEPFAAVKSFGRFMLRQQGQTIAAGIVLALLDNHE
jgi:translation elongation factor EF-1alpha